MTKQDTKGTGKGNRRDICILRHFYYPLDKREKKHAEALAEAGYAVDLICLRDDGQKKFEVINGVNVYRMPLQHKRGSFVSKYVVEYGLAFLLFTLWVTWKFMKHRYRVVQYSTMPDFLVFTTMFTKLFGAKIMIDLHDPTPEMWITKFGEQKMRSLLRFQIWLEQRAIKYVHAAITVSEALRTRFIDRGADPQKITVVSNACNADVLLKDFDKANQGRPPKNGKKNGRLRLITHGLIEERNGHETVIEAILKLKAKKEDIIFEVPGFGSYEPQLKELVKKKNWSELINLHGFIPYDDLLQMLHDADIGIVSMLRSPYSELVDTNKMYEFMVLKKPLILSRLPSLEVNFDDECVTYFEPGNAEELAECIWDLYQNPEKARQKAEKAHERIQTMSWEMNKATYLKVVAGLL